MKGQWTTDAWAFWQVEQEAGALSLRWQSCLPSACESTNQSTCFAPFLSSHSRGWGAESDSAFPLSATVMLQYLHTSPNGNTNERRYLNAVNASPVIVSVVDRNERRDSAHCTVPIVAQFGTVFSGSRHSIRSRKSFPLKSLTGRISPVIILATNHSSSARRLTRWRDHTVKRCCDRTKALCVSKVI